MWSWRPGIAVTAVRPVWPVVFAGQLCVALCFSELAGRWPVSGAIFQWSSRLAGVSEYTPADVIEGVHRRVAGGGVGTSGVREAAAQFAASGGDGSQRADSGSGD